MTKQERINLKKAGNFKLSKQGFASQSCFEKIYNDFFIGEKIRKKKIVELGPGRFEMLEMFQKDGAICTGFDKSKGVYKNGINRGYSMFNQDFKTLRISIFATESFKYHGLFCRESINAFWFKDIDNHFRRVRQWCRLIMLNGWGWILPCNRIPPQRKMTQWEISHILDNQIRAFESAGFKYFNLSPKLAKRYGQQKDVINNILFIKNLKIPAK